MKLARLALALLPALAMCAPTRAGGATPLSPRSGGRSITPSVLEVGDIVVSTSDAPRSWILAHAIHPSNPVSHVWVFVDKELGLGVEAQWDDGVQLRTIDEILADDRFAVVFRSPKLTKQHAAVVATFQKSQIGKAYARTGLARPAGFKIIAAACEILRDSAARIACTRYFDPVLLGTGDNQSIYCSELVLKGFAAAEIPLTTTDPSWSTPADFTPLILTDELRYVGHLKTTP